MKKQVSRILCIIIILCICISPLYVYAEDIYDYSYQEEQALYVDAESEEVADFNLIEDYYEEEANEQDCNEDLYQESEETIEELFLTPVEETLINNQEELSEDSEEVSTDSDANSSEPENTSNEIAEIETTVSYSLDETLPIESESDADIDDITIDVESKNEEDLKTNEFSEDIILSEDDEAVLFSNDADITQLILNIIENNNKIDGYYYIQYTDALTQYQFTITYRHDIEYLIFHSIQGDYTCQFDYDINNKCIVNDKVILSYLNSGYYPMVSIRANAYVDFTNYVYGDNLTFSFDESLSINSDLFGYEDLQENGNIAFKNAIKGWEIVLLTRAQSSLEKLGFEKFYYDNSDIDTISDNDDTSYIDDGKQYEQEPNNSRVSATILTLGQECNGEIGSYEKYTKDGDDVDFYAVNLKEGNKYRFSLTGYNDNFASTTLIIKIHKPDDNEISFSYQMERTGKDYYELTADVTGTYYIHLYNYSDYKTNKEHPYTIKVEEIISNSNDNIEDTGVINTDEQEPNNSRVSATVLTLGKECIGEIGSYEKYKKDGEDADFYAVNLKEGNKYRISFTGYNDNFASTTLIIKIHKPDDNEISFSSQMERTGKDYYEFTSDVTGTYYIHFYNYFDTKTKEEHLYTIKVEEIISNSNDNIEDTGVINTDEQEPNNSRVSATVLTLGKECIGEIGSYEKYKKDGEDVDFYAVNLKEGNKYRISFTGYNDNFASTTLIIKIHKPDDNEISFSSQMERTGKDYYEFTSDVTGTYYIHFYNYFDSKTKEEHPYTIMVEERANDIYLTKIEAVSATCNSNGNISYYKSSNGKLYLDVAGTQEITLEDTIIFATGHTEVKDSAIAATCTRTGLTEGSHCSVCGATIAAQELIPALGHNWSNWKVTKEATEETAGVETRTCSNDPSHVETRAIPVLAHTHNLVKTAAKAATCTASGNIDYWTCSGCGRIFSDASGNNEINIEDTIIKAKGHTAVTDKAKAATCTATGLTEGSHCSVCNYVIKEQSVIPALGHKWSDWKVTKEATEETAGVETRTCSNDPGHVETRDIPVKAHTHNLVKTAAKAATCTEAGNKDYWTCSGCGRIFSDASGNNEINIEDTVIPAKGHTSVTDAEVAATCTTTGKTEGRHCSVCSTVIKAQEVIPALGHHLVYVQAKEATTSAAGNKEHYKCDRCNKLFSDANGKTEIAADSVVIPKLDTTVGITSSVSTYNVASGIQVEWEPVDGASGYYIWRKAGSGSYSFLKTVSGGSNTSYTDTTATSNGKVYIYLVYTYAKADGKTVYSDDCNYSFTYRLSAPTISRVTNSASKKMTVKWNKNAKAAGYVIQYSLKSSFANSKYVVAYKASTVSKVISGLTKGKTYYVRMCSYRRYGGITHYSDWSNTQKVKISK